MRYTLECNILSVGNEIPWVMFGGAHGLTVERYHKDHTKSKAPALDTEYADNAQRTLISLQALYAQNSWIYPSITQYLRNDAIIIPAHSIILPTLNNTTDFCSIGQKHADTVLKPWHPLLTHSVILPSLPHITITVSHHGKAPLIDNHPKTGLLHHSEASGWCAHQSFNEMM